MKPVGAETAVQVEGAARDGKAGREGEEDAQALRDAAVICIISHSVTTRILIKKGILTYSEEEKNRIKTLDRLKIKICENIFGDRKSVV